MTPSNNMKTWQAHLLKPRLLQNKLSKLSQKSCVLALMVTVLFSGILSSRPAQAVWWASEFTQIANNVELAMQYGQQIMQYKTQLDQYKAQLKNLEQNPGGLMKDSLNGMLDEIGGIMSSENAIGGNMAKIDSEFSKQFGNEAIGSFADKFKSWSNTSRDTLGGSLRAAGLHRDAYPSDAAALKALFNQSQSSAGTTAAVQQLSALTTMQIQQSQKLSDLLATQNIASSTWMATNASKAQVNEERSAGVAGAPIELPATVKGSAFTPLKINK